MSLDFDVVAAFSLPEINNRLILEKLRRHSRSADTLRPLQEPTEVPQRRLL